MPPTRKRRAPQVIAWLIFLAAFTAPAAYLYLYEEPVDVTVTTIGHGRVEQTITAISSGTVMPLEDSMIAAGFVGVVVESHVKQGQRLKRGDLLFELEHAELDAQVYQAEANLDAGRSRLKQAKLAAEIYAEIARAEMSQAEEQLNMARIEFDRVQKLSNEQAVSQSRFDNVGSSFRVAEERLTAARARQRENLVRQEEIATAKSILRQLEAALTVVQTARDKAFVKAPFSGVVAKVFPSVGEAVAPNMPLIQLVQDSDCYVRAPFDEANASAIFLGQIARMNLDAYRGRDFHGEITHISPIVSVNPDLSRTLDVEFSIGEDRDLFVPGMSVDVLIIVEEKKDVLFVPTESLIRDAFTYVVEDGRARRRDVEIGIGNWSAREILKGLREGETLITSVAIKELRDGVRIRVVEALD